MSRLYLFFILEKLMKVFGKYEELLRRSHLAGQTANYGKLSMLLSSQSCTGTTKPCCQSKTPTNFCPLQGCRPRKKYLTEHEYHPNTNKYCYLCECVLCLKLSTLCVSVFSASWKSRRQGNTECRGGTFCGIVNVD